jgi:hypothetical protein
MPNETVPRHLIQVPRRKCSKRMNSTRVPTIAFGAGGVAAHLANGSGQKSPPTESSLENLQTFTLSRILSGIADPDIIETKTADCACRRGRSVHVVRSGVPISTTMQKRPEGRPL